jgi:hypothetical protein
MTWIVLDAILAGVALRYITPQLDGVTILIIVIVIGLAFVGGGF